MRDRYFDTTTDYPFERTEHEVRLRCDFGHEGDLYTVVKPDEIVGYTIHVGGRYPASEFCLHRLHERLNREFDTPKWLRAIKRMVSRIFQLASTP